MIPSTQAQLKMIPFWRLKMIHHHSARVLHLRLKIQPGMTTAWRHAHPANQRPVLKACLKHQTPDRLISFQQKQGEGGRKELNKKRFPGNLWTLEALGICGHWEIYKHRHWKLWDLLTLGNTNTDTGSSENLRTLGNTNTDTGSSGICGHWEIQTQTLEALGICGHWEIQTHPHTCMNAHTETAIQTQFRCSHAQCCLQALSTMYWFQTNTTLQSLDTHTLNTKKTDTIIPRWGETTHLQ